MNWERRVKDACARCLPSALVDSLRAGKRIWRRTKHKINYRLNPVIVSRGDLVKSFRELGLRGGSSVCMYSSMSRFGQIEGGAATVIAALEEVIGKEGCIAMPAFPIIGSGLDYLERGPIFDLLNTPSNMGAITETFRKMPGVLRSLHPTHSLCAKGRGAGTLVEGHENCRTPFGHGSPFWKMIEMNTDLIAFGVGAQYFTLYHTFEDLCGDSFPYSVYLQRIFPVDCFDQEGKMKIVSTPVHDPALSRNRIDTNPEIEAEMRQLLLAGGKMATAEVGKGWILSIKASDLLSELHRFLKMGLTIYGRPTR
jgi:aminoglycoside 3-N-acetyltransferase